jgi:membrane protease YdiL (CAAX protease family)
VSDLPPPQLPPRPPLAPPPPLPPAPYDQIPRPVIRWGIGDVFWGLLVYLGASVVASVLLLATGAIDPNEVTEGDIGQLSIWALAVTLAAGWCGFVGWPAVATYRKGQRSLARDFGLEIRWVDLAWGLLGAIVALVVSAVGGLIWLGLTGDDAPSNGGFLPDEVGLGAGIALWLLVGVATPIAEELFFRGLTLRAIGRRWNLTVGVIASSLVFGVLHASGGTALGSAAFFAVVTAGYGAVFALLVVRAQGRLGPAIVAHLLVNTVAVVTLLAS